MNMTTKALNFNQALFLTSASKLSQCPEDEGAEVAFAGRSNAGKSSAINTLTGMKKLARTSKTPGRTQLLNFFTVTEQQRLVDLPGYGFAKVPIEIKLRWQKSMDKYLRNRQSLRGLVLVMDIRHPLTEFDQTMLGWTKESGMPVHILLTKADKLKRGPGKSQLLAVRKALIEAGHDVSIQMFSALKKDGIEELCQVLNGWLAMEETNPDHLGEI